ncbi:hypothetical protein, partial [Cohnella fermenti]|uniref:hypothetical protein n=1 Tax=Cohnella fermenti TaxID=2565925 RepID=UPI001B3B2271
SSENFDNMVGLAWCSLFSAPMAFRPDFFPISQFHLLDIAPLGYCLKQILTHSLNQCYLYIQNLMHR